MILWSGASLKDYYWSLGFLVDRSSSFWSVEALYYSMLINGVLTPRFNAKNGLRQDYPMSPYLFVLVVEYLNRALKQLKLNPDFNYYPKCAKMEIVHIFFADDLLMCCRGRPYLYTTYDGVFFQILLNIRPQS